MQDHVDGEGKKKAGASGEEEKTVKEKMKNGGNNKLAAGVP